MGTWGTEPGAGSQLGDSKTQHLLCPRGNAWWEAEGIEKSSSDITRGVKPKFRASREWRRFVGVPHLHFGIKVCQMGLEVI